MNYLSLPKSLSVAALALAISACGGGDDNDDEINALEDRVDAIEASLGGLESENDSINASLDAIEDRLDALEGSNDTITAELAEITALLDQLEERLNGLTGFYEITLVNATANQPIAPTAVVLHSDSYYAWDIGAPASVGLEVLAESGSPVDFIDEMSFALDSTYSQDGPIAPGDSRTVYVEAVWSPDLSLTIAGMPVNTNDAFSGTTAWNISALDAGMSTKALLPIYDAGTEANTETPATVPGPAAGGEGYNADRDDVGDYVVRHQGVVTSDDGLATSALDQSHRFDQGALYVTVTRM